MEMMKEADLFLLDGESDYHTYVPIFHIYRQILLSIVQCSLHLSVLYDILLLPYVSLFISLPFVVYSNPPPINLLFSPLLFSSLLFSPLLYSSLLFYPLLSSPIVSSLLFTSLLCYPLLFTSLLCYPLLFSSLLFSSLLFPSLQSPHLA